MKIVVQRVKEASVSVDNVIISSIEHGFLLLVGIEEGDTMVDVEKMANKVSKLRIFDDKQGRMNLDIHQVSGTILSVSQFTLAGDTRKGNRPSFVSAMKDTEALTYFNHFNEKLRSLNCEVYEGQFGEMMDVSLINDGPVTIILNTKG